MEVQQLREENAVLKAMLLEQRVAPPSSKVCTFDPQHGTGLVWICLSFLCETSHKLPPA